MSRAILPHCIRKPRAYNPNYPPAVRGGEPYTVGQGESFASIGSKLATKYHVSPRGMAKLLLLHNFNTTQPDEVNFYLENALKCETVTQNRKNYMFTPGQVIYLPPLSAAPKEIDASGIWFGIGMQGGGVLVGGAQTLYAYMVSLETPLNRNFILEIGPAAEGWDQLNRLALGLGGGVSAVLVIISSLFDSPETELRDLPVGGDLDVTVSLGADWSKVLKSAKLARLAPLLEKAAAVVKKYPRMGKYAKPEHIENLANAVKDALKSGALGMKMDSFIPQVVLLTLPISQGVELSVGVSWGYCNAYQFKDTTGIAWKRPRRASQ
jgi:hypothetical protein